MGLIDKLLFWRKETTAVESEIEGCFTLPGVDLDQLDDACSDDEPVDSIEAAEGVEPIDSIEAAEGVEPS